MTSLVVDASVAAKWFFPEVHSEDALRLPDEPYRLLAPDLLYSEVGNTLWKRVARKEISRKLSIEIIQVLETLPLISFATKPFVPAALEI